MSDFLQSSGSLQVPRTGTWSRAGFTSAGYRRKNVSDPLTPALTSRRYRLVHGRTCGEP
jgi:hypothetical protein